MVGNAVADGYLLKQLGPDSPTYLQLLAALQWLEVPDVAQRELAAAVVEARHRGAWLGFAVASAMLGYEAWKHGRLQTAEADARTAVEVGQQMGWLSGFPQPLSCLVEVLNAAGDLDQADRLLDDHNLAGELPNSHIFTELLGVRGRLRLSQGRRQAGIRDLQEQEARLRAVGDVPANVLALHAKSLVPALVREGRLEQARQTAEEALGLARAFGRPRYIADSLQAHAFAYQDGPDVNELREAASIYEQIGARVDLARTLLEVGSALRRERQPAAARDPLRRAMDIARSCGARPVAERAEHELRAAGGRPRRDRVANRDVLTATERRVAQLASNGMTNRQIAENLFVTYKTVGSHLEHIFRKFDIHSRRELPEALARDEDVGPKA